MKKILFIISLLLPYISFAQMDTSEVHSKITDVTVFYKGAQVSRNTTLNLLKGQHLIVLKKLPAELSEQSIQVKSIANAQILSVKTQSSSVTVKEKQPIKDMQKNIEEKEQKIRVLLAKQQVYEKENQMLWDNRLLGNEQKGLTVLQLKEAADFYRNRMNEIALENLRIQKDIKDEQESIQVLNKKINELKADIEKTYTEILVTLDCEKAISSNIVFSYFVASAAWVPYYDFRVEEVADPLAIVYNANVFQSTGEDWKNVKLKLSGNDPLLKTSRPELYKWYLEQNSKQTVTRESYSLDGSAIKGKVTDKSTKEPIAFANILLMQNGKQFAGTTTDFDGNYLIKPIQPGYYSLKCSYVGYKPMQMNNILINKDKLTFADISIEASSVSLETFEVVEYKIPLISRDETSSGSTISREYIISRLPGRSPESIAATMGGVQSRKEESSLITTNFISNDLQRNVSNLEYVIETPYSILSDGKDYAIRIKETKMVVDYHYLAIPKVDADPFLMCNLINWQNLNLLDAKYNIFFKGTFVGESVLNTNEASDTLKLSLGRDKSLFISRTGMKEINDKKINGDNIKETIGWNVTVKNTKPYPIHITIEDQYPITERKSIDIKLNETSDAKVETQTGKLSWDLLLKANERKELKFNYTVKYPKYIGINAD
ncbi:MAG: mucoidy inhibitor MuiA family protein [Bacteroidetes bacterium]|nr:mucoidy inhibitor MuiA family protein [Bacteroidota bacterium]